MLLKQKRLILTAILITIIVWVPGVQSVWADEYDGDSQKIGKFKLYMDPDEETLTYCELNESAAGTYELVIPEKVAGITVKHIGAAAFDGCKDLTKLVLPDTVESIGPDAFYECIGLKEINIPSKVVSIEPYTFYFCENMEKIALPNNLLKIGESAFRGSGLIEVAIPRSVTSIGEKAFWDISDNFVIKGYEGTEAEKYAEWENITFVALEGDFPSTPVEPGTEKLAQTITAKSFTKTYGNKPFELGASAKTELSYKSSNTGVATVDNNGLVTLKGPGKTTITITAAANSQYKEAAKKVTITVKPKTMAAPQVKCAKTKTLSVSWKKDTKASGYQVVIAQDSKFMKGKKTANITSNKTTSATFKKLAKGKTYYAKVRAYKKVGTTKLYGAYSKVKSIRTK